MVNFIIDAMTPCLVDETGAVVDTEIIYIKSRRELKGFNKKTGWYINWSKIPQNVEVYAVVLKGTQDIQGLVALKNDVSAQACYIHWACVSPSNNNWENHHRKYKGVGGHLFAIAANKSMEWGYDGFIHAIAMDKEILTHYVTEYGAAVLGIIHKYHFMINEDAAKKIMEAYTYEQRE